MVAEGNRAFGLRINIAWIQSAETDVELKITKVYLLNQWVVADSYNTKDYLTNHAAWWSSS